MHLIHSEQRDYTFLNSIFNLRSKRSKSICSGIAGSITTGVAATKSLNISSLPGGVKHFSVMAQEGNPKNANSIYEFTAKDIDGNVVSLAKYQGHVCVIVNVASK